MKLGIKTTDGVSKLKLKTADGISKAVPCACCDPCAGSEMPEFIELHTSLGSHLLRRTLYYNGSCRYYLAVDDSGWRVIFFQTAEEYWSGFWEAQPGQNYFPDYTVYVHYSDPITTPIGTYFNDGGGDNDETIGVTLPP